MAEAQELEGGKRQGREVVRRLQKLATIKAKTTDSVKLCWWCKDSLIAMAKVDYFLTWVMSIQPKIPSVCFQSALKGFRCNFS